MNPTNKRAYVRHMYSGPRKSRKKVQATLKRHHGNSSNDFYRVEAWRNKKNNVVEETADCSVVFSPNTTQDHDQLSNPSAAQHTPKTYSRGIPQIRYEAIACSSSSNRVESVTEEVETVDFDWPQPDPQTEAYQPTVERTSSDNLSGLEEHRGTVDDTKVSEDADNDSDVSNKTEVGKEKQTKRNMSSDDAYSNAMTTGVNIIIARVYKFFKSEYEYLNEKYGQIFDVAPFSQYKERTSEATGFDVDVVSRALEEVEIQDGGAKKRKLNVNDSQSCEDSERPHDYEPQPGTSSAAQITEGLVIYKMQSKPTADLIIKVENDDDFEGMQEEEKLKELKRKRNRDRQRAYYQRQKDLKQNEKERKKAPKSNAERQRIFRQRNAEKSFVATKRQKLDRYVVKCRAVENIQKVTLQKNLFHSQKLEIYEQHDKCVTPEVTLHRNTGIPGDVNDKQNWIHLHLCGQHFTPFYEVSDLLETIKDSTQNDVHVDANIQLLRDYDEDPTEDKNINDEIEIEIDREDGIGENIMDFIVDGTVTVYTNYLKHSTSHIDFYKDFTSNTFGHSCIICDRLCWKNDLKMTTSKHESILKTIIRNYTPGEMVQVCSTCYTSLEKERIPLMSTYNGFAYPKIPSHLPTLNLIEQRLISPRIPFKQIRRLRHVDGQYGVYGQIINLPVEVNTMVKQLPRNIKDDHCIYVHLNKKLIHKTSYVQGLINKSHIKEWLLYLVSTPLFINHDIKIDDSFFTGNEGTSQLNMDEISEHVPIEDNLVAMQQTLLWNEDYFSSLAPDEYNRPVSILMDDQIDHAEELSFPTIYGGQFRTYRGVTVTPFMQATSELRRTDRRATDPQHLLYIAAKIMRLRVKGCVNVAIQQVGLGTPITKETIQSEEYISNCLETNLAFLRCIPNSVWFWSDRTKDLFAMIRQLGPPTAFMNLSANETGWDDLLKLLYKLKKEVAEISDEVIAEMSYIHKAQLVNEDAVTCAIYFNKMVNCLLKVLQSKKRSPFGRYRVVHYFRRIEFQHRGSPHAHILLWLENVPDDVLSNDPEVIKFIDELVSVSASEASGNIKLVTHKHTFTCYKKMNPNKKQECRFGAPYMPTKKTINLIPMKDTDPDYSEELFKEYNKRFKIIGNNLENFDYKDFDEFYWHNGIISDDHYYNIIRAGINRPKLFYKRTPAEKWHNTFNPFVLHHLKSNMDFQIILDEYTCATYIVEYINKYERGISNLQRQIIHIMDEHPEFDIVDITKKISIDILQSVEMKAQEAAWYLLREPMVKSSVVTVYIPTVLPTERARIRKSMKELEAVDDAGTNVRKENWFDKYEKRPDELRDVTLAQFVAKYYLNKKGTYSKRDTARIIRYRNYNMTDNYNDYGREVVLLHVPFKSEENDIIAENKFIQIYEENKDTILERRKDFETNLDIEKIFKICRQLCRENDEEQEDEELLRAVDILHERDPYGLLPSDPNSKLGSIVKKRENLMDYQQLFMANDQQRDIHNLQTSIQEPFKTFYRMFGVSDTNKDPLNKPTDSLENTATQVSKAVLRDQLKIETDNLESAVYSPDDVIVVKEEIDIGDEKIG